MELFLFTAIGITAISFVSIALTKPYPETISESSATPTTSEINPEDIPVEEIIISDDAENESRSIAEPSPKEKEQSMAQVA